MPNTTRIHAFAVQIDKCPNCLIHACIMVFAFEVLMVFGFFLSRYVKKYAAWWFPLHIFTMLSAFFLAICGVILAATGSLMRGVSLNPGQGGPSNTSVFIHHIFGYLTVSLFGVQILIGVLAHFFYNPKRTRPPIVPDMLHRVVGYLTLICADVTVYLGLAIMKLPYQYMAILSVWIAFVVVSFICMEVLIRLFKPATMKETASRSSFMTYSSINFSRSVEHEDSGAYQ